VLPDDQPQEGVSFEVVISDDPHRTSVVLADQIKSLDWRTRRAVKKGVVSSAVLTETLSKLQTLL
jgi:mRNA interferase MazF